MEFFGLGIDVVAFLLIGSFVAGLIDAICGGGGLISIPVLLSAGFSPIQAIAANKLQGAAGSLTSAYYYLDKGLLDKKHLMALIPPSLLGGVAGTLMLNYLSADFLSKLLPVLLVVMALYFLFSKQLSDKQRLAKMSLFGFASVVVPLIAFYDGFFGAGAGACGGVAVGYGDRQSNGLFTNVEFCKQYHLAWHFYLFG